MSCLYFQGDITAALARQRELEWPLLLFLADDHDDCIDPIIADMLLHTTSVCQVLRQSTDEFKLFLGACPGMVAEPLPRVHLFPPPSRALPPIVLSGETFTSSKIAEAVAIAQQWTDENYGKVSHLAAGKEVDLWNAEAAAAARTVEQKKPGAPPPQPRQQETAVPQPATARPTSAQSSIPAFVTLQSATKKELVATGASTSLVTLWDKVAAKGSGHVADPSTSLFALVVNDRTVTSRNEAAASMPLTAGSTVRVVEGERKKSEGSSAGSAAAAPPRTSEAPRPNEQPLKASSCSTNTTSAIAVRCLLPDGSSVNLGNSFASSDHLRLVFDAIAGQINRTDFSLGNSYPPRRFGEEDMSKSLGALGLTANTTLRVTWASAFSPPPPHQQQSQAQAPPQQGGLLSAATGLFGTAAQYAASWVKPTAGPPPQNTAAPSAPAASASRGGMGSSRGRGGFATLSSLSQREEQQQQEGGDSSDPKNRKSNRYFGGLNTEYEGEPK